MQKKTIHCLLLISLVLATIYGCQQSDGVEYLEMSESTFFNYDGEQQVISALVDMMKQKNDSCDYVDEYLETYGRPLWSESVLIGIDEMTVCVVPVFKSRDTEIESLWIYNILGNQVSYFTYSKHNDYKECKEQYWMFDFFTQTVLHMQPKSGEVFKPVTAETRTLMAYTTTHCREQVNYAGGEAYEIGVHCWDTSTYLFVEGGLDNAGGAAHGTGNIDGTIGGGGGGPSTTNTTSNISSTPLDDAINKTFTGLQNLTAAQVNKVKSLYKELADDCAGERLLMVVKDLYSNSKINIRFTDGNDDLFGFEKWGKDLYSRITDPLYFRDNTLIIRNDADSDEMFHELFHAYQFSFFSDTDMLKNNLLNFEVAAHFLQFKYMERKGGAANNWRAKARKSSRIKSIVRFAQYVDYKGVELGPVGVDLANKVFNETLVVFQGHKKYGKLSGDYTLSFDKNMEHIRNITKNC